MIVMMVTKVAVKKPVEPQNNLDAVQPAIEEEKNEGQPSDDGVFDEAVTANLMVITGMTKEMCQSALEAAAGDPNVAYDYLNSGNVPEKKEGEGYKDIADCKTINQQSRV